MQGTGLKGGRPAPAGPALNQDARPVDLLPNPEVALASRSFVALLLGVALLGVPGCGAVEGSARRAAAAVIARVLGANAAALLGADPSPEDPAEDGPRPLSIAADETAAGDVVADDEAGETGGSAIYKIVQPNGTVRFTSDLAALPADQRAKAERLAMAPSKVPARPRASAAPPKLALPFGKPDQPPAARARSGSHEVVLYTTSWCGWCKRTIAWLDAQGVAYENKDVERDAAAAAEMRELTGGDSGVPVVVIDGEVIQGFNQGRMQKLLNI